MKQFLIILNIQNINSLVYTELEKKLLNKDFSKIFKDESSKLISLPLGIFKFQSVETIENVKKFVFEITSNLNINCSIIIVNYLEGISYMNL